MHALSAESHCSLCCAWARLDQARQHHRTDRPLLKVALLRLRTANNTASGVSDSQRGQSVTATCQEMLSPAKTASSSAMSTPIALKRLMTFQNPFGANECVPASSAQQRRRRPSIVMPRQATRNLFLFCTDVHVCMGQAYPTPLRCGFGRIFNIP